ncbi:nuclear transcription factor Y subunit B-4 [Pyrus ussuriensis x Pyrus communis]|uniref:Nuclear transcription factor Y subunit B-4 n=1 Tax=Pyrus ussuriensis x Pyrus communis TaxID=2448454 RepID=A0A5N5FPG3_9ROSA|nr:nuclear transcription factor Y subunit B-4 [Pyrus ussuriensis x Pyrus communis]KAB2630187.1 nuclear transcription factor Y subunit B-4 [Pyrus ussuriensis x Pyrus communis]
MDRSINMVDQEQDGMLPIANVGRIMKQILPPRAKISREAKQTMQECATEFLSFVTGEASDKCHKENRKTVNGDDICWALSALGFDNHAQATTRYLHKYREAERDKAAANNQNTAHIKSHGGLQVAQQNQTSNLEFRVLGKGDNSLVTKP